MMVEDQNGIVILTTLDLVADQPLKGLSALVDLLESASPHGGVA